MTRISRQLRIEPLEDRTLMSTCHVTRLTDMGVGKGFRGDLRYCITKVNAEPGPDAIDFTVTGTIKLNAALPPLATDISIQGPGSDSLTIDAQEKDRVFNVTSGANVEIAGITITNGLVWAGAFLALGGGIQNASNLIVRNSVISENTAHSVAYYGAGGGIYNAQAANLTVIDSVLSDNQVFGDEFAGGGGICNSGAASIYSSAIVANTAEDWSLVVPGLGAGISNTCPPPGPPVSGFLLVHNSTVHSNVSKGGFPGDEGIGGINSNGVVIVSHSTIASNTGWGIGPLYGNGQTYVRNSIVAGNSAGDVKGALSSSGYNLIGNSEDGSGFDNTDLLNVDPMLGLLQDNGGPTPTAALLPGSPAINAGDNTDAPEFDQRGPGFPRIVNGTIDIGAFEVQATGISNPSSARPSARRGSPDPAVLLTAPFIGSDDDLD